MTAIVLPTPAVPITPKERMAEIWYRYFQQINVGLNTIDLTTLASDIATLQSDVAALQAIVPPWTIVAKTADESRNTTIVFANDAELVFTVVANTNYRFRIVAILNCGATGGYKFGVNGPAAPTLVRFWGSFTDSNGTFDVHDAAFGPSTNGFDTAVTSAYLMLEGILQNGANAGNVAFEWAQQVSNATNTTVLAGSYLEYATV